MTLQSKRHKKSSTEGTSRDRLSELPDAVIVHILSFLPISDAVKTVLLRCCGDLWTRVPSLHFSYRDNQSELSFFVNFVRNVLMFHKMPTLDEFHFETTYQGPEIETWTRFALSREAMVLKVNFLKRSKLCTLPRCILFNQSLLSLDIRGCSIEQQSRVHMASLRKLVLEDIWLSDKMLEQIVSGCPSLEELSISHCNTNLSLCVITSTNIKVLKIHGNLWGTIKTIDCPCLRTLHISGHSSGLEITDVSSLSEVKIDLIHGYDDDRMLSLLEKFGNVEVVKLTSSNLEMLADRSVMKRAGPSNRWKHLTLDSYIDKVILLAICGLLRNSESLEELTVYASLNYNICRLRPLMQRFDNNMFLQELSTPCVMSKLKIVTLRGYWWGYQIEDQPPLVEFVLKNAVNLEKLVFVCGLKGSLSPDSAEFVKQVAGFRRASSKATVVFA